MESWLQERRPDFNGRNITNGEEMSLSRVGTDLYDKIFKHYTKKQWDKYPAELDASVLARLPFRLSNEDRYFSDPYEGLPKNGYTEFFKKILLEDPNITVRLNVDYFKVSNQLF
jgi:UDP-galactopyranose mutase